VFSALISVPQLAPRLGAPDWVVIDCRFDLARPEAGEAAYRQGHIPGARYAHLDRDLAAPRQAGSGRHPLPEPEVLAAVFGRWGIDHAAKVVAYDDAGGAIAARLWWLLRWMGHADVGLLDGGWGAWQAAGMAIDSTPARCEPKLFTGGPGHMPVIDAGEIAARLQDPRFLLIDARAAARFSGEVEPIDVVAGHVPGAKNLPFQDSLDARGSFRDRTTLEGRFGDLMRGRDAANVAVMCGSGVTACHNLFSMELAGYPGARLYPGSWSEWITDPVRPIAGKNK
jgi:thiosulfate/3-mercaptopyruvate sulfurtransferase